MNDRDLFSAIFLAVIAGEHCHPDDAIEYTQRLFVVLQEKLKQL